jgi:Cytochrome P450
VGKRVAEVVDEMIAPLANGQPSFDLIADFTMIPTVIVAEMLGVPPERHDDFRRWSHDIVSNLAYGSESEEHIAIMKKAAVEVNNYLKEEIERHRREMPDDMITAMLRLEGEERMTAEEIRSAAVLLLIAGYDTTAKTMSNALIALAANPAERSLVAEDLLLVPEAIEEAMRWNGPVQFIVRIVTRDAVLRGQQVKAGESAAAPRGRAELSAQRHRPRQRLFRPRPGSGHRRRRREQVTTAAQAGPRLLTCRRSRRRARSALPDRSARTCPCVARWANEVCANGAYRERCPEMTVQVATACPDRCRCTCLTCSLV